MNENLQLRITKAREFLKDAYSPKEKKWYQSKYPTYELVTNGLETDKNHSLLDKEIVLKNNSKGALITSAFLIAIILGILFFQKENNFGSILMLLAWVIYILAYSLDKKPKIILNKKAIWAKNFEDEIPWENIIAIYFKTIGSGEDLTYSFLLHYYDEKYDYFKEIEFSASGYGMSNKEIIAVIKHFSYNKKLA
jgi:hypothetical protein